MPESTESIARKALEYLNAHDLDSFAAMHAEHFELTDTASGETFHGREGARKNMEGWFGPFPDARIEVVNLIAGDSWVTIEAIGRGTHTGPLAGPEGDIPPTGRRLELPFCSTLRIENGQFVAGRDYYNVADVMQQLGLMPEPAGATA
jgi:steroid delta-isomerase-like uncharacterized protein